MDVTARGRRTPWAATRLVALPSSSGGWLAGALCFGASVTPSLYPRPWLAQGVVSGVALAAGYGAGAAIGAAWRTVVRRSLPASVRAAGRWSGAILAVGMSLWFLVQNYRWQVDVRRLMEVPADATTYPLVVAVAALVVGYLLVVLGRSTRTVYQAYARVVARLVPPRARRPVRVLLALVLTILVGNVVVGGWAVSAVNDALVAADARSDAGARRPASPLRSGGPGSLIPWETLGSRGRAFVTRGPGAEELTAFSGEPASDPIRVYAGLTSAASDRERAELAVAELERTGAFGREALLVITPTGTGAVNHYAVDPLEYMYHGDTAAVAVQYSYLPSWLVMAGNQERAKLAAAALFAAVSRRLVEEPPASRPRLLVYGESLGSFGSEAVFDGLDDLRARADGALWVGPPRANVLWREFTADRDPGSPVWQPVYRGGAHVRFGWDGSSLSRPNRPWTPPRVAYLQHATDPITWLTPASLFERPDWLEKPRGPGVTPAMRYLPVVTFLQVTIDTVLGASAPVEHGHIYGPAQAEAWALVAPPASWTPTDTDRLHAELSD